MIILGTIIDFNSIISSEGKFVEEGVINRGSGEQFRDGVLANNFIYIYIASETVNESKYIEVVNCTNRGNPQRVGRIILDPNGTVYKMEVDNGYLYVLTSKFNEFVTLYIINIANPIIPVLTGKYHESDNYAFLKEFAIYRDYCYIFTENGLRIINIANKNEPVLSSTLAIDGYLIEESEGVLYLDCSITDGYVISRTLRAYRLTNPAHPSFIGEVDDDSYNYGMAVKGKYVYTYGNTAIKVVDFTDAANPQVSDKYSYPEAFLDFDPTGIVTDIAITEKCLIASGEALFEFNIEKQSKIKRRSKLEFGDFYCKYLGVEDDLVVSISSSYGHIFTLQPESAIAYGRIIGLSISGGILLALVIFRIYRTKLAKRK